MRIHDAAIVGAGPAGAAAAITLARSGLDVVLIDKAEFPRDKICGDGLTSLALGLLEDLGVDPTTMSDWMWASDCQVRSPSGHSELFALPRDQGHFAAVVPRAQLDAELVDVARKAGAEVIEGHAVTGAVERSDGVELTIGKDTPVAASWVIAADGMWSPMRKHLGVAQPGYLGEWHAFRQYASGVGGRGAEELFVSFEADLLPGYFWSFPLPGERANVGFGIQRGGKVQVQEMKRLWADLLERPHVREVLGEGFEMEGTHRAWPIPARIDAAVPATRRTMFVGDAVGACDVMTGEGIGQALLSGVRAAESVIDCGQGGSAAADYAATIRSELVADHRMSALLVRALRHRKGARAAVRVAGATAWTRRNFARWLFEDYPRAILATPRRWGSHSFTGPGAYRDTAGRS
ncbi:MAG: NAD(P)/FAD-dependent oxidoreductase [Actinomycetia bacterium]|nr:NAD(P)/FAD-dependent oxidoreductase [Actinomycetes bacterium]